MALITLGCGKQGLGGWVHGPWGEDVLAVAIAVPVPAGVSRCTVSWRSW